MSNKSKVRLDKGEYLEFNPDTDLYYIACLVCNGPVEDYSEQGQYCGRHLDLHKDK